MKKFLFYLYYIVTGLLVMFIVLAAWYHDYRILEYAKFFTPLFFLWWALLYFLYIRKYRRK